MRTSVNIVFCFIICLFLSSCDETYDRPAKVIKIGPVNDFLYNRVYVPESAMLVFRDSRGWSAMSTRCTHIGCDLSYQENLLFCPCCRGSYDLDGSVIEGTPKHPLPHYEMFYKDGDFFVDTGKKVSSDYRFTTEPLEKIIKRLNVDIREQRVTDVPVSNLLSGHGPPAHKGNMFTPANPIDVYESEMIK